MEEKKDFTYYKLYRIVVNKFGPDVACVHAVIANSSQENRICELSDPTIGNLLHMSYQRVSKARDLLLEKGYIEEVDIKTKYGTKAYRYVADKVADKVDETKLITLESNDKRIKAHADNRKQFIEKGDTNHITPNNDNNKGDTDRIIGCDESYHQVIQNVSPGDTDRIPYGDTNHIPIKNLNYKELKELKELESSENLSESELPRLEASNSSDNKKYQTILKILQDNLYDGEIIFNEYLIDAAKELSEKNASDESIRIFWRNLPMCKQHYVYKWQVQDSLTKALSN